MLDVKVALDICLDKLSLEYDIEEVDSIPQLRNLPDSRIWRVQIPALILGKAEDIEAYILFPNDFPYSMPYMIIQDERFRYLPHISIQSRKLCLYEDGEVYDAENIEGLIRESISKTRRWVEYYYGRDNSLEYAKEIKNYWNERYEEETSIDDSWILFGDIPVETCEMFGMSYANKNLKNGKAHVINVVASRDDNEALKYIKCQYKVYEVPVLYLVSLKIPDTPPFYMTGQEIINRISDDNDKRILKKILNRYGKVNVLFSIGLDYALGGVYIHGLKVTKNGFRKGTLTPFKVLTSFENKNKKFERLYVSIYSSHRIAERTAGEMMDEKHFLIAGLGSIGSNLCYYLNGYNNVTFSLTDRDWLTVDNIGRHLLGFEYINQHKSYAVAHYLQQYRPDRGVEVLSKNLQQLKVDEINRSSAVFVCTGDVMSEKWLLMKMTEGSITRPAFILWLEPYGISGIMIYVNPEDIESVKRLIEKANDCFNEFCLISKEEYVNGEKLTQRDVGCNGSYALYSANDVTMFLSAMFPIIDKLLEQPTESKCYRWVGNIKIAIEKSIRLVESSEMSKNTLQRLHI
jgi:molybdopterin/thiamine biosynthesis adenylyltransferase